MPVFSVIIPCYNCQKTILDTLNSLAGQKYQDFEVICINDGSTDATLQKLEDYRAAGRLEMHIFSQSNSGVSAARNRGLEYANGEWIVFLDADDMLHPSSFEILGKYVAEQKADTYYFPLMHCVEQPVWQTGDTCTERQDMSIVYHNALYKMERYGFYCYVYNRKRIKENHLVFPENIKYGEDREFIWKYLAHTKSALYIDKKLYWYRDNPNSAVNKTSWRRTDALYSVKNTYAYLKNHSCEFADAYFAYMYARNMLAVLFNFARGRNWELFDRLGREFDVKAAMKKLVKLSPQRYARAAGSVYLVSKRLFYLSVGLISKFRSL